MSNAAYMKEYHKKYKEKPENRAKLKASSRAWKKTTKGKLSQARSNSTLNGRYRYIKYHAKKKGLPFDITKEDYAELISQGCFYCSGKLSQSGYGLDRQTNSLGYTKKNCVPCCKTCNVAKNEMDVQGFKEWLLRVQATFLTDS